MYLQLKEKLKHRFNAMELNQIPKSCLKGYNKPIIIYQFTLPLYQLFQMVLYSSIWL